MELDRRASFLLPLSLLGCRKSASPEGAAAAFLDAYYVERDHDKALGLSVGSARSRVQHEKDLRSEAGGAYGVVPRVYYSIKGEPKATPDGQELTYQMTIDSQGVQLHKEVRVLAKKEGDDWKVAVFGERDVDAP